MRKANPFRASRRSPTQKKRSGQNPDRFASSSACAYRRRALGEAAPMRALYRIGRLSFIRRIGGIFGNGFGGGDVFVVFASLDHNDDNDSGDDDARYINPKVIFLLRFAHEDSSLVIGVASNSQFTRRSDKVIKKPAPVFDIDQIL
jgi:hypothetical protein